LTVGGASYRIGPLPLAAAVVRNLRGDPLHSPLMTAVPSAASAPLDPALLDAVERALGSFLAAQELPENLRAACLHAVLAGGKRLRPILVLESALAAGGTVEGAMPAAVAIEFVHAFSLVHDDLPALDNDTMRRGKPTCHVAFGEAMAILAGDCLLALAPVAAARASHNAAEIQRELMSGTVRMIAGQVYDTLQGFPPGLGDGQKLELVHHNKTGALLEASCRMGALAAGADASTVARLTTFGRTTGLMFQIVDDLIDATQTAEHAGKATGKDAGAGKLTYPAVHGVDGSRREVDQLHREAAEAIAPLGARAVRLSALLAFLANRTK
jgi:geranylgeranyl pyrophosphate synthase